jgi:hypothetical protein
MIPFQITQGGGEGPGDSTSSGVFQVLGGWAGKDIYFPGKFFLLDKLLGKLQNKNLTYN